MVAPKGNDYGLALRDPETRQEAYRSFCQHIADGYPIEAWSFRKGEVGCVWRTMISYINSSPEEFQAFLKAEAHCLSYKKWFDKGIKLTDGLVKGNPSPQTWATIMRNMFHWDKEKKSEEATNDSKGMIERLSHFFSGPTPVADKKPEEDRNS